MLVVRRWLPLFALLLSAVVGTQTLDVVACPDEAVVQHEAGRAAAPGSVDADCLCHLAYVAEDLAPPLAATPLGWAPLCLRADEVRQRPAFRRVERPPIG